MRYDQNDRESSNVEDRRGEDGGGGLRFPGGGIQIPIGGGGGLSITTLLIIGALMMFMGINPLDVLFGSGGRIDMPQLPQSERPAQRTPTNNIPGLPGSPQKQAASEDDERRRYYGLTALGRRVARAEAARLEEMLRLARAAGLTPHRS